jgi:hypothetical protein
MTMNSLIRKSLGIALFVSAVFPFQLFSQTDEVLMRVPTDQYTEASRSVVSGLRVYHRFPDFLLVGAEQRAVSQLGKAKLTASILDDQPWSASYAVVSTHPGNQHPRTYSGIHCKVLYTSTDFDIIKASPQVFEQLRALGFTCVEIERNEIPVETHATHLPPDVYDRPNDFISDVIANVDTASVRAYLQGHQNFVTRYWNNANRDSVSRWLRERFLLMGITDVVLDSFQYNSTWQQNVIATIPGTVTPTAELLAGGHHDSYSSNLNQAPGADDNASGTVAGLEMARVLRLVNYQPALTMRFTCWAAEEAGLRGSASYAQRARAANRDIKSYQNYDMIANRNQAPTDNSANIVWYTTSEAQRDLHAAMMRTYTPLIPVYTTSSRSGSDSYSFWQQNYRTLFGQEKNFTQYYHTPNDLIQYLDMTYCANMIKAGLAMMLTLDMMPASVAGLQVRDCGDGTALYASWDSVQVPDWYRYKVYIGTSPGVYTSNNLYTTRSARLSGLTAGTRYYVGVSIVDLAGREGVITELSEVPRTIPQRPTGVWVENYAQGAILTWRKNLEMDLRGYNVYRSIDSTTIFTLLNVQPSPDTLWIDTLGTAWPRFYYLTAIDSTGNASTHSDTVVLGPVVSAGEPRNGQPFTFRLDQNYPNPFNPMTNLGFEVDVSGLVSLKVFDVLGREVATLVNEVKSPGRYNVVWNARLHSANSGGQASQVASGVYFYTLKTHGRVETKRMLLTK